MSIEVYQERREAVATAITQNPNLFNMNLYADETDCGTEACIAGWCAIVAEQRGEIGWNRADNYIHLETGQWQYIASWAAEWLGLSEDGLFYELFASNAPHQTPEEAALAIKREPYRE